MKVRFASSLRDLFNYLLAGGLSRLLPFFILPYVAHVLNAEDFGLFTLYRLYIALGATVLLSGVEQGLFRLLPEIDESLNTTYFTQAFYFTTLFTIFVTALLLPFKEELGQWLFNKSATRYFLILPFLIYANNLNTLVLTYLSARRQSQAYFKTNLTVQLLFTLLFFAGLLLGFKLQAFFVSFITANFIVILLHPSLFKAIWPPGLRLNVLKDLLQKGFPLMLVVLLTYLLYQSDHYLIKYFLGISQTGKYGYGYRFAAIILLFVIQTNNVWLPRLYNQGENYFKKHLLNYSSLIALGCMAIFWILVAGFTLFPGIFLPEGFGISKNVLIVAGLGYVVYGQAQMIDGWLILKNRGMILTGISLAAVLINVWLNVLFIPRFGLIGAAGVTTLSFVFIYLTLLTYLQRSISFKLLGKMFFKVLLYLVTGFSLFTPLVPWWTGLLIFVGISFLELRSNPLLKRLLFQTDSNNS